MQKILAAALLAAGLVLSQLAWAEDKIADVTNMDALRAAVRADKKEFVASTQPGPNAICNLASTGL